MMLYSLLLKVIKIAIFIFLLGLQVEPVISQSSPYQTWLCQRKGYELKDCDLDCPDGFARPEGCEVCKCRESLCVEGYCPSGSYCKVFQTGSNWFRVDTPLCVPDDAVIQEIKASTTTKSPTPETLSSRGNPELYICEQRGRCDVTGSCDSPDYDCRQDGRCCKRPDTQKPKENICLQEPSIGMCRAFTIQYVYDVSSGQCIEMTYGGCGASENSFTTLQECQQTCEKPCNKPQVAGPCRANLPHYYFDRGTLSCQLFDYGGCEGNGNNFETSEECEAHCGGIRDRILSLDPSRGKAFKDSVTKCGTGGGSKDGCTEDVHSNSKGTDGETKDVDVKSGDSDSKSEDSDSKSKDNDNKSGDSDSKSDDSDSKSEDSDGKSEDSDSKSGDSDSKSEDSDSKSKDNDSKSGDSDSKSDDSDSKSEDNDSKSSEDKDGNGKDRGGDIKNGDLAGNGGAKNGNREQETTQTPETTQVPTARGQPNQPGNNGEEPDVAFGNLMKYRPKKLFDSFNFAAHILFRPNKKPKQNKH